jgi:hypothetical protein
LAQQQVHARFVAEAKARELELQQQQREREDIIISKVL